MVEYWNNAREQGDFEPVMGLIDAYDAVSYTHLWLSWSGYRGRTRPLRSRSYS